MKFIFLIITVVLSSIYSQDQFNPPLSFKEQTIYNECKWHPDLKYYFNQFLRSYERPVEHKLITR